MPFSISGTATGPDQPPELLVAVNGRLTGVIGGYVPEGDGWTFIGFLGDVFREGSNDVAVYEVIRVGDAVTLNPVAVG